MASLDWARQLGAWFEHISSEMPSRLIIHKFKQTVHSVFKMEFRQDIQARSNKTLSVEVI